MTTFHTLSIPSPLGPLMAISDDSHLHALLFLDSPHLEKELKKRKIKIDTTCYESTSQPLTQIQEELDAYFSGALQTFQTPLRIQGTPFQQKAWQALLDIPYAQTCSYLEQAKRMERETAFRAVANANAANRFPIVIPCHRVINHRGGLGGYTGGISRKIWLIDHEKTSARR